MTMFTEVPFRQFFPFHLEPIAGSGKGLEMAGSTLDSLGFHMIIMAKNDRTGFFERKRYIAFCRLSKSEGRY